MSSELLSDYAKRKRATIVVKGLRAVSDYEKECQMALINRGLYPELETMLLPASPAYQYFSSSMAREMIRYRQPLEKYLPAEIIPMVREMTQKRKEE